MVKNSLAVQETTCNTGDMDSIPALERSLGEGNGKPLQYSCLEDSMDRGAWWATMHEVAKNRTQVSVLAHTGARVHTHTQTHMHSMLTVIHGLVCLIPTNSLGVGHSY